MRVLISGASGLIGSALAAHLRDRFEVLRLVRREPAAGEIGWQPESGRVAAEDFEGLDAVVHLAGESIAAARWSSEKKERIRASRVGGTELLARTLGRLARPAKILISASAVGYYGDRGDEELDEESPPGNGFLAEVCRDWEAATAAAAAAGIRVVCLRTGMVLARTEAPLARLVPLFRLGLGGRLGSGRQYVSWIALEDTVTAIQFLLKNDSIQGPINLVAPHPVTNREFTVALGRALHRPNFLAAPAVALRLALGEMADEMLLASTRARPRKLLEAGFEFRDPELEGALRRIV